MSTEERRAPGATRFPFEALVEVGGALGPTFEAQAVNVSEEGIQLRTAYLPEPGQPLTCRFDAGPNGSVLAAGEVAWAQGSEKGGEFGVRFTEIDVESVDALKHLCGVDARPPQPAPSGNAGSKVRLHIDGLASPMRAKIKDARSTAITVGSDLGFLQVGRQLDLEDAQSGSKRPATIDRVDVAVDPTSHVPQLVVTLRYVDARGPAASVAPAASAVTPPKSMAPPSPARSPMTSVEQAAQDMRGAFARNLDKVRPAVGRIFGQMKTTMSVLAKRRANDDTTAPRRTTAPPPTGGLYAAGRRVVRESGSSPADEASLRPATTTRRRAALAGGVVALAVVGALALKRGHHEPASDASVAAASASAALLAAAPPPPAAPAPATSIAAAPATAAPSAVAAAGAPADADDGSEASHRKEHVHVAPFSNGPVHHANVLRLKMDGAIEAIEGAQQPTGFTVKVPGRKSLEAAAPLAARDARIGAIKVSNDASGANLSLVFKDGVPNYRVSARGDTLVIALAPEHAVDHAVADKDEKGGRSGKHGKHGHTAKPDKTDQAL